MKIKKLLVLGLIGTLALNIVGCGGVTVNVSPDGAQIEFDDNNEKVTSKDEERVISEEKKDVVSERNEEDENASASKDDDKREADKDDINTDSKEDETSSAGTTQEQSDLEEFDARMKDMVEELPTGIDWEDEEDKEINSADLFEMNAADATGIVLLGDNSFICAETGETMFVEDLRYLGDTLTEEGHKYIDIDHDGEVELIVLMTTGYDGCYEIFDYIDGTVYGHQLGYRSIVSLYEEGYCLGTSGADTWDVYYFNFTTTSYTANDVAGCRGGEYYILDETVTKEEYDNYINEMNLTEVDLY